MFVLFCFIDRKERLARGLWRKSKAVMATSRGGAERRGVEWPVLSLEAEKRVGAEKSLLGYKENT